MAGEVAYAAGAVDFGLVLRGCVIVQGGTRAWEGLLLLLARSLASFFFFEMFEGLFKSTFS